MQGLLVLQAYAACTSTDKAIYQEMSYKAKYAHSNHAMSIL